MLFEDQSKAYEEIWFFSDGFIGSIEVGGLGRDRGCGGIEVRRYEPSQSKPQGTIIFGHDWRGSASFAIEMGFARRCRMNKESVVSRIVDSDD